MKRTELKRTTWLKQKTPMRRRSRKRQTLYVNERIPLVIELLEERPNCEARLPVCSHRSVDVHEIKTRARGGSIVNRDNLMTVCRTCHDWITEHPTEAAELGFVKHSWDE